MTCCDCGRGIPARTGRGRQAARCEDCATDRRRLLTNRRIMRMTVTVLDEWIAIQSFLAPVRRHVVQDQEGRCKTCGKERRLMLAFEDGWVGLCSVDLVEWLDKRRT